MTKDSFVIPEMSLDAALNFIVAKEAEMTRSRGDAWRRRESAISSPAITGPAWAAREDRALKISSGDIRPEERVQLWLGTWDIGSALLCWPRWSFLLTPSR